MTTDEAAPASPIVPSPSILIIDDDPVIVQATCNILTDYGFRLFIAFGGEEGIELAHRHRPDLILLDLRMPRVDGLETLRRLKAAPATAVIGVLFFSIHDTLEEKLEGFRLGALDYITKPVAAEELIARVMVHLRQRLGANNLRLRLDAQQRRTHIQEPGQPEMEPPWAQRIQQARQILEQRITDPPSLQELADAVHLSPKRLSSAFHTAFGMTAFGWLREYRMQQAAELLRTTRLPVGTIAERVGLGNASFSTQFKKRFLQTPRDYRAMTDDTSTDQLRE